MKNDEFCVAFERLREILRLRPMSFAQNDGKALP